MSEYIKREDAIKAVNHLQEQFQLNANELEFGIILKDVFRDVIPSADVVEVVHGHWEWEDDLICSECGCGMVVGGGAYNYCPNCGARMDGESDE